MVLFQYEDKQTAEAVTESGAVSAPARPFANSPVAAQQPDIGDEDYGGLIKVTLTFGSPLFGPLFFLQMSSSSYDSGFALGPAVGQVLLYIVLVLF